MTTYSVGARWVKMKTVLDLALDNRTEIAKMSNRHFITSQIRKLQDNDTVIKPDANFQYKRTFSKKKKNKTGVINDPLGQPTVPTGSDVRLILNFWDGHLCENSDHYMPELWSASWIKWIQCNVNNIIVYSVCKSWVCIWNKFGLGKYNILY